MLKKFDPQIKTFRLLAMSADNESPGRKKNIEWKFGFRKTVQINLLTAVNKKAPALVEAFVEITVDANCLDDSVGGAKFSAKYKVLFELIGNADESEIDQELSEGGDLNYLVDAQASLISFQNFKLLLGSSGFNIGKLGYSI